MNCEEAKKRMLDFLYEDSRNAELEGHLASCPACRETRDRFAEAVNLLGPAGRLQEPPAELFARIERATAPRRRALVFAAALAAAACLATVAWVLLPASPSGRTPPSKPVLTPRAEHALWERYEPSRPRAKGRDAAPIFDEVLERALDRAAPVSPKRSAQRILTNVWEKWPSKV